MDVGSHPYRGLLPRYICILSSFFIDVSKAKSHDQKGVFRRGEMTIFKHGYVVSLTFTGVCCGDTFAC